MIFRLRLLEKPVRAADFSVRGKREQVAATLLFLFLLPGQEAMGPLKHFTFSHHAFTGTKFSSC